MCCLILKCFAGNGDHSFGKSKHSGLPFQGDLNLLPSQEDLGVVSRWTAELMSLSVYMLEGFIELSKKN